MNDYFETFRMNVKFYRDKKGFSQRQLAIQADCTDGTIGQIESGKAKPSFDMIVKIANDLQIHPADLFLRETSLSRQQLGKEIEAIIIEDLREILQKRFGV